MRTLMFIITALLISCEENNPQAQDKPIHAVWNLVKVTAGFSPIENYSKGQIVWEFNSENQLLVTINIELSKSSNITLKEDGTYNFELVGDNLIKIDSAENNYFFYKERLIISFQEASDGPRMEFIKN